MSYFLIDLDQIQLNVSIKKKPRAAKNDIDKSDTNDNTTHIDMKGYDGACEYKQAICYLLGLHRWL